MSQWRWTTPNRATVEITKSRDDKWEVTLRQTSVLTFVDGEYVSSQDAMTAALDVVARDLEATLAEVRKELKSRKVKP